MRDPAILEGLKLDAAYPVPLHSQLRAALRELIEREFADGELFYSEKELLDYLPISRITVRRALADLTQEGLLHRARGVGTIVTKRPIATALRVMNDSHSLQQTTILVPHLLSEYTSAITEQLRLICADRGMCLQVCFTGLDEKTVPPAEQGQDETGVVLLSGRFNGELFQQLSESGRRAVAVDPMMGECPFPSVSTDGRAGVRIGLDYLQSLGHERITLLVNEPVSEPSVVTIVNQFCISTLRRGLADGARVIVCGTFPTGSTHASAYAHMEEVWNVPAEEKPTAILTTSDPGAWAALKWLAQRGIAVPDEVSVLGMGDWRASQHMLPALSSLAQPVEKMGQRVMELLWDDADGQPQHESLSPVLMVRESVAQVMQSNRSRVETI